MRMLEKIESTLQTYSHASLRASFEFIVIAFVFVTAQPTRLSLLMGTIMSFIGLVLRIWTIGYKRRVHHFFVLGPYRFVRHPFYLGSFLLIFGLVVMGANAWVAGFFLVGICLLYSRILNREEARLARLAGSKFRTYQSQVTAFIPQIVPQTPVGAPGVQFSLRQGLFHGGRKEIDSVLGLVAGIGLLYVCMILPERQWFHITTGFFLLLFVCARVGYYRMIARAS